MANFENHPWFTKLNPSKLVLTFNNLLADLLICQSFCQTLKKSNFPKLPAIWYIYAVRLFWQGCLQASLLFVKYLWWSSCFLMCTFYFPWPCNSLPLILMFVVLIIIIAHLENCKSLEKLILDGNLLVNSEVCIYHYENIVIHTLCYKWLGFKKKVRISSCNKQ